ncbi:MAG: hypothetical protein AAB336_10580, partial [Acidobacteriota bacterium]
KITRDELREIETPAATRTHQPLSHFEVVEALTEALSFRYLKIIRDEYAVSPDGMKMFGVMDLSAEFNGGRFSIGLRNSNDKSMRLALTAGMRIFVCDNLAFSGDFTPLSHKHTRNLELRDSISIAVDRIHRGFEPLKQKIKAMKDEMLAEEEAKLIIYQAFLDRNIRGVPRHLMSIVHDYYFHPKHEAFYPRNLWSLSNAFTSAFKKLSPIKQFEVTARLGSFLTDVQTIYQERRELEMKVKEERQLPTGQQNQPLQLSQQPLQPAQGNVRNAIQFGKLNQNPQINNSNYEDIDEDDFPDDPYDDEVFEEYFDQELAEEQIDEAMERLVDEYESKAA